MLQPRISTDQIEISFDQRHLCPSVAAIVVRARPPVHADRLAVRRLLGGREVHLLRIFLKTFDLFDRVKQKRTLVFVSRQTTLRREPRLQLVQLPRRDRTHLIRRALSQTRAPSDQKVSPCRRCAGSHPHNPLPRALSTSRQVFCRSLQQDRDCADRARETEPGARRVPDSTRNPLT